MAQEQSKISKAWSKIFSALPIIERVNKNGHFDISAKQIKEHSEGEEARLMAKFDFREQLPAVMKAEKLGILAIENGVYRIGRFDPFIEIQETTKVCAEKILFPNNIITLHPQTLKGESAVLDAAMISGVLSIIFGEPVALTIRGRTRNAPFEFALNGILFPVDKVQIEVDGGYEGATTINLVEAKIDAPTNISIRQLLYPQMSWEKIIGLRKTVRTFLCFYQEPILRFIPVVYENGMARADHANERAFILEPEAHIDLHAIKINPDAPLPVRNAPFPQADRFEKVLAMSTVLSGTGEMTKEELASNFDLVPRQIDYYFNALRWLGLAETVGDSIRLTEDGARISTMPHAQKMRQLAEIIFAEPVFNHALRNPNSELPSKLFERWNCNPTTQVRRMETVRAWIKYFEGFSKK